MDRNRLDVLRFRRSGVLDRSQYLAEFKGTVLVSANLVRQGVAHSYSVRIPLQVAVQVCLSREGEMGSEEEYRAVLLQVLLRLCEQMDGLSNGEFTIAESPAIDISQQQDTVTPLIENSIVMGHTKHNFPVQNQCIACQLHALHLQQLKNKKSEEHPERKAQLRRALSILNKSFTYYYKVDTLLLCEKHHKEAVEAMKEHFNIKRVYR